MINTVTLAMKFYQQPKAYTDLLDGLNMVFTAVFALEFIFKLAAFRFKVRISHVFDFSTPQDNCNVLTSSSAFRTTLVTPGMCSTSS